MKNNSRIKIKNGDEVLVRTGRDRGKKGKIIKVIPDKKRVVIEGVNMRKKHVRPKRSGEKGSTVYIPSSLNIANVQLICPSCSLPSRVGYKVEGPLRHKGSGAASKKKVRICKKCENTVN